MTNIWPPLPDPEGASDETVKAAILHQRWTNDTGGSYYE